ncbi:MAG TPA: RagB/SusD family nutrient uptake outer membrane protein, partial [Puia sp.]|nr:RagB/SusD family nutrient uptake outer membrane protein [Puia sp.]
MHSMGIAIMHERQEEFFAEWGHRWFDLKRTGTINTELSVEKSGWQPTDSLYPIPQVQIQNDPNTTQNPGY